MGISLQEALPPKKLICCLIFLVKPKNIYLDQANIQDNRMLYNNVTLASYQQKDPVFQQQKKIFQIRQQKEKLIKELQLMKK